MAKESKTKAIVQILQLFEEAEANEIETTVNKCLKLIGCQSVDWKKFEVYEQSISLMKILLRAMASEYIMLIAEKVVELESNCNEVKILIKKEKDTSVWTIPRNATEMLAVVSISSKRLNLLQKK